MVIGIGQRHELCLASSNALSAFPLDLFAPKPISQFDTKYFVPCLVELSFNIDDDFVGKHVYFHLSLFIFKESLTRCHVGDEDVLLTYLICLNYTQCFSDTDKLPEGSLKTEVGKAD